MDQEKHYQPQAMSFAGVAPPTLPGQIQPWTQWYSLNELDTNQLGPNDGKPQQCSTLTQAVTAV